MNIPLERLQNTHSSQHPVDYCSDDQGYKTVLKKFLKKVLNILILFLK